MAKIKAPNGSAERWGAQLAPGKTARVEAGRGSKEKERRKNDESKGEGGGVSKAGKKKRAQEGDGRENP